MADLLDGFYQLLAANSAVLAIVQPGGASGAIAIYQDEADKSQGLSPYIVLKRVSGVEDYTLTGPSNICESRVQVDCVCPTRDAAKSLRDAALAVLSGFGGNVGSGATQVRFASIFCEGKHSFSTASPSDETLRMFGQSMDFSAWHLSA